VSFNYIAILLMNQENSGKLLSGQPKSAWPLCAFQSCRKKRFTAIFNVGSKLSVGVLMWWRRTISLTSRVCPFYQRKFTCWNYEQILSHKHVLDTLTDMYSSNWKLSLRQLNTSLKLVNPFRLHLNSAHFKGPCFYGARSCISIVTTAPYLERAVYSPRNILHLSDTLLYYQAQ
jgi:hypothetical protein